MMSPKQAAAMDRRDDKRRRALARLALAVAYAEERGDARTYRASLSPKARRRWRWHRAQLRRDMQRARSLRLIQVGILPW